MHHCPWNRSVDDCEYLVTVHGDAVGGDDMAEVCHRLLAKGTFGALELKLMCPQSLPDELDMTKMVLPGGVADENVIKNTSTNRRKKERGTSFIKAWNIAGHWLDRMPSP